VGNITNVTRFAAVERDALADLLTELGPDAPTLCEGWTTRDLAAHLVVRATRADAAAGIMIKPLAGYLARVQARAAEQDWSALVAKVRRRPGWAVFGEEAVNQAEYYVHHEDVRRAQPGWQPRELPAELQAAMWGRLGFQAKLAFRRMPANIKITSPGYGTLTAGRGGPEVELTGPPSELVLFLMGRQRHANVELTGSAELVERLKTARLGV
jgi:uncharacterized protein (TIGR03085 family)